MTTLDIILLVLIGIGAVLGFMKGFLRQLAGLFGLVAGFFGDKGLYVHLAEEGFQTGTGNGACYLF